jgi:threonine/homoserine/homoserine lactone efflux protein
MDKRYLFVGRNNPKKLKNYFLTLPQRMNPSFPSTDYDHFFQFLSFLGIFFIVLGTALLVPMLINNPSTALYDLEISEMAYGVFLLYHMIGFGLLIWGGYEWSQSPNREKKRKQDQKEAQEFGEALESMKEDEKPKDAKSPGDPN